MNDLCESALSDDKFTECIERVGSDVHLRLIRQCELDMCASDAAHQKSM